MTIAHRRGYMLRKNHANRLPSVIVAIHTETRPCQQSADGSLNGRRLSVCSATVCRFRRDGASSVNTRLLYNSREFAELLKSVCKSNYTTWVVGHKILNQLIHLGLTGLMSESVIVADAPWAKRQREDNNEDDSHCYGITVLDAPPTILSLKVVETAGRFVAVDSQNYLAATEPELIERATGIHFDKPTDESTADCIISCSQTASQAMLKVFIELMKFVREKECGIFRYTAAGQSMAAFRHGCMRENIFFHDCVTVRALERRAYYGGRFSVFRYGKRSELLRLVDVSSMYPAVMADNLFPCELEYSGDGEFNRLLLPTIKYDSCIAEVLINTPSPVYPHRVGGLVTYPIGQFRTTLAGPELELARRSNRIVSIGKWAQFRLADLFSDYISKFWSLRLDYEKRGDLLYASFCKMLLNCLYGKFAQQTPRWIPASDVDCIGPWKIWETVNMRTGERAKYRSIGYDTQIETTRDDKPDTLPSIAAFVTAHGRLLMNKYRQIAGDENVYYQGCDNLLLANAGYNRLASSEAIRCRELGYLRLQWTGNECEIRAINDYSIGSKNIVAGRSARAVQLPDGSWQDESEMLHAALFSSGESDKIETRIYPSRSQLVGGVFDFDRLTGWAIPPVLDEPADALTAQEPPTPASR